jgi:hypothetical protein
MGLLCHAGLFFESSCLLHESVASSSATDQMLILLLVWRAGPSPIPPLRLTPFPSGSRHLSASLSATSQLFTQFRDDDEFCRGNIINCVCPFEEWMGSYKDQSPKDWTRQQLSPKYIKTAPLCTAAEKRLFLRSKPKLLAGFCGAHGMQYISYTNPTSDIGEKMSVRYPMYVIMDMLPFSLISEY